jgi:uncharacterized RDD family membrane protein YckC
MASAEYSVLTPERVNLQYDIAGVGSRGAAVIIDTTIQYAAIVIVFLTAAAASWLAGPDAEGGGGRTVLLVGLILLAIFAISNGYFMLFEIVWNGQTPGKRVVGVRVIRENGYPLRPVDAVIRNVVRMVDWLPFLYGAGIVTMLLNNRARRLGDFASGTIVVREGPRTLRTLVAPSPAEHPSPVTLSNADATLVRDFLTRRGSLDGTARLELAQRLAAVVAQHYGLSADPHLDAERFLEQLVG